MINYTANDLLKVMKNAKNYNDFLTRIITNTIKKHKPENAADFGCSDGYFIERITEKIKNINIFGVEIDKTSFMECKRKNIPVYENIEEIDTPLGLIYSLNVLEHIENDIEVIKKFYDMLNDEGVLILYVPALQFLFSSMDKKAKHCRRYSVKELKTKVESAGFKVYRAEYCDSLGILVTLLYKLKDKFLKDNKGTISVFQIKAYDAIFFISRLLDKILFKHLMGKNAIIIAKK